MFTLDEVITLDDLNRIVDKMMTAGTLERFMQMVRMFGASDNYTQMVYDTARDRQETYDYYRC